MPVLPAPLDPVLGELVLGELVLGLGVLVLGLVAPEADPLVPVAACSCRHLVRSSPVRVSQRPLLDPVDAAPLVAPLAPTLVSGERGAVVPEAPAESELVPVDGVLMLPEPLAPAPGAALWPVCVRGEPEGGRVWDGVWAKEADENARNAAAVAV